MRPAGLQSKIFLDGADPRQTREALSLLGFLDGQTTNPTLLSKNSSVQARLSRGEKFPKEEIYGLYKQVVREISGLLPQGSVSIEVYADRTTTALDMLTQGREMFGWIPNAHIKFPTTKAGLTAAVQAIREGIRVNMTLVFSQEQAAAVYAATLRHGLGQAMLPGLKNVFVSPFVGRLDDRGENGMDLVKNVIEMYQSGDGHVGVLTASVRSVEQLLYAIQLGSDCITVPFKVVKAWGEKGFALPEPGFHFDAGNVKTIPYKEIGLNRDWTVYNITHELTDTGIEKFSADWNSLIYPTQ
ncbi:transaldolase [Candidatus Gottesmanbacteria bacterium]|nr:transaldolase [Candidatus Gottesmanbacteria bacterium]